MDFEDFGNVAPKKRGMTKAQMNEDLRKAVLNTGGTLIVGNPKADHVAWALVAASRALYADPIKTLKGAGPWEGNDSKGEGRYRYKRARIYAGLALMESFPDAPKMMLARLIGVVGSQKSYLWNCEHAKSIGAYEWWDDKIFDDVVTAIKRA